MQILLVEDNKINQCFALALLKKAGYDVHLAENGVEAVEAVQRADYHVVLMDIQMPELDGVGATAQIRALPAPKCSLPIIAMTANAMAGSRELYLNAGMDDYIPKPVRADVLLTKLRQIAADLPSAGASAAANTTTPKQASSVSAQIEADVQLPVFNLSKIASLQGVLAPSDLRSVMFAYIKDTDRQLAVITASKATDDFTTIAREAHVLVSTAGNLGAEQVSHLARALERASRAEDREAVNGLIAELDMAAIAASEAMRSWMFKPNLNAA